MRRTRMSSAGAVLVVAMAFAVHGPAFAGGAVSSSGAAGSLLGTLGGSQLSTTQLGTTRGGTAVNIDNSFDSVKNTLNDTASSGGTLTGTIGSNISGWGIANNNISNSSGIMNSSANTGNNVMINQSMSIFVNAQ